MSQYDSYTQADYVRRLRTFLGKRHPATLQMQCQTPEGQKGRLPRRSDEVVQALETAVNFKAARCEAINSTFAERVSLAQAYAGLHYSDVASRMSVSREAVRQWAAGIAFPKQLEQLAAVLDVSAEWLEFGGEHHLSADSRLGVRVGEENKNARDLLYGHTLRVLAEAPEFDNALPYITLLEEAVFTNADMGIQARRAGGRWHMLNDHLIFAPWIPIAPHGLSRRFWTDDVEAIIEEALTCSRSVYSAWHEVKRRCEAAGLAYPRMISLHKRVAKEKERVAKFGVDVNSFINAACAQSANIEAIRS